MHGGSLKCIKISITDDRTLEFKVFLVSLSIYIMVAI